MTVIVTGKKMQKSCGMCDASGTGVCRKWMPLHQRNEMRERAKDCPLKSVEGLIEQIVSKKYAKPIGCEETRHNNTIDEVIGIINEYCGE